ncbi:hypothetical protein B0H16DRAFT_1627263 [Mycena metata]|uniref:Uncharacterized protein n=1 Tax=Mycena metata TaxID=1033252 RepID=A0AAD7MDN0_9AGAR|nr:hypothetical protein B0H16DRAFT_1627263 [Mycena metata]
MDPRTSAVKSYLRDRAPTPRRTRVPPGVTLRRQNMVLSPVTPRTWLQPVLGVSLLLTKALLRGRSNLIRSRLHSKPRALSASSSSVIFASVVSQRGKHSPRSIRNSRLPGLAMNTSRRRSTPILARSKTTFGRSRARLNVVEGTHLPIGTRMWIVIPLRLRPQLLHPSATWSPSIPGLAALPRVP